MVKLFSKNSNLCDHNSPTSQTDGQMDRQTDRRHAIPADHDGQRRIAVVNGDCLAEHQAMKTLVHVDGAQLICDAICFEMSQ